MENWTDVIGYEGKYQINDLGEIKSLKRYTRHNLGGKKTVPEKILKKIKGGSGYYLYYLNDGIKGKNFNLHRILAIHFLPNPENKPQINHIDGNKLNNNLSNLEWVTAKENSQHACDTGLNPNKGGQNNRAQLVFNIETGIFYETIRQAWFSSGMRIKEKSFQNQLNGFRKNKSSYIQV